MTTPAPNDPALAEQAHLLRRIANHVPVALAYFDRSEGYACRYANRGYAAMFGHDEHSVLGLRLIEVIGADAAALIAPQIATVLNQSRPVTYERTVETGSGRRHIEVSLVPHVDVAGEVVGAFVQIADITRHRESERALRESEDRLARFLHATTEGIVYHRDGYIIDANPPVLALLGYALDEMRGRWTIDFVAPDQRERVTAVMNAGAEITYETAVQHRDGTRIPVEFIVRTVIEHGVRSRMTIVRDLRDRLDAQSRIRYLAQHDQLTGLPNRGTFIERMNALLPSARVAGSSLALLFLDLDHFKRVNDSLGHFAGDELLRTVAQRITGELRADDLVGRFGGDEFLVLLAGLAERTTVEAVARKLLAAVAAPVDLDGSAISVTPSIGIAMFPADGADADSLIQHADTAMYEAKASGRAECRFFAPAMAQRASAELRLESRLTQALELGQFELHFQPEVEQGGAVIAVEALVRWHDPERGLVEPAAFLPLVQARPLMLPLARWVLAEALRHAARWQGTCRVPVAVHPAPAQLQSEAFFAEVRSALADAGVDGRCLELEVTEQMLMDDPVGVQARLARLRALGVRVALDAFGTGYTSLARLRDLPIDRVKIDRGFVAGLPADPAAAAIVRAVLQVGDALALQVVAEGVETEAQRDWLVGAGCRTMQGRLIAPPMPAGEFASWLARA